MFALLPQPYAPLWHQCILLSLFLCFAHLSYCECFIVTSFSGSHVVIQFPGCFRILEEPRTAAPACKRMMQSLSHCRLLNFPVWGSCTQNGYFGICLNLWWYVDIEESSRHTGAAALGLCLLTFATASNADPGFIGSGSPHSQLAYLSHCTTNHNLRKNLRSETGQTSS